MTVVLPPSFGKADWTDYTDYWRDADATWLQERTILRYATAATRTTDWATPTPGQVTYREDSLGVNKDRLEMYSKEHTAWVPLLMLANIANNQDNAAGVGIGHKLGSGKGVVFEPTRTVFDNPIYVMGGVLTVDATGATIKTHATKAAKLTTDANGLVSDSQITAPTLAATGAVTAASATLTGTLTAPNITLSGNISGGTFTGAVAGTTVNASAGGTFNGVSLGTTASMVVAPSGLVSQGGFLTGDTANGYLRFRNPSSGALSTSLMTMDVTYLRFRVPNGMPIDKADGSFTGAWLGGAIYSASDPGAANFPNGTIWCS